MHQIITATADPVTRVVVLLTVVTLVCTILGHGFRLLRRASRLLDHIEKLPDWMADVDDDREDLREGLEHVENLSAGIARELNIPVRRRPVQAPERQRRTASA